MLRWPRSTSNTPQTKDKEPYSCTSFPIWFIWVAQKRIIAGPADGIPFTKLSERSGGRDPAAFSSSINEISFLFGVGSKNRHIVNWFSISYRLQLLLCFFPLRTWALRLRASAVDPRFAAMGFRPLMMNSSSEDESSELLHTPLGGARLPRGASFLGFSKGDRSWVVSERRLRRKRLWGKAINWFSINLLPRGEKAAFLVDPTQLLAKLDLLQKTFVFFQWSDGVD